MVNHPNRSKRTVRLTEAQIATLKALGAIEDS